MSVKYISDSHLYDVYSLGWREDYTLEQYAKYFRYQYDNSVDEDDTVIWVGDIGYCCEMTKNFIRSLKGRKVLVLGNHDTAWGNEIYDPTLFQGVYRFLNQGSIYVQHIPDVSVSCDYFIHGHHHRYDLPGMFNALKVYSQTSRMLNCSADLTNCRPMSLPELITNKEITIDYYRERKLL